MSLRSYQLSFLIDLLKIIHKVPLTTDITFKHQVKHKNKETSFDLHLKTLRILLCSAGG